MPTPMPLILSSEPVSPLSLRPSKPRSPSTAVVYATGDGELHVLDNFRPLPRSGQFLNKFRMRYEIDLAEHHREVELRSHPLPALGDAHYFEAHLSVSVRVHDPEEVVRRKLEDGLTVVYPHLTDVCRGISRKFGIEEAADAEDAVNRYFRAPVMLDQGLTITRCAARLRPDRAAREFLKSRDEARRETERHRQQTAARLAQATADNQVADVEQQGRLARESRELSILDGRPQTPEELVKLDLARRGDSVAALDRLHVLRRDDQAAREFAEQQATERLGILAQHNLLGPTDVPAVLPSVTVQPGNLPGSPAVGPGRTPAALGAASWDSPVPTPAGAFGASGPTDTVHTGIVLEPVRAPQVALPVYLVVDLSAAGAPNLDAVNSGLRAVASSLAAAGGVNEVVRLSVLGYTEKPTLRLPLQTVDGLSPQPLVSAGGEAWYGRVFDELTRAIPDDVDVLKSRGSAVLRPMVFFLADTPPTDQAPWSEAYAQLMNKHVQPYTPQVIAGGIGDVPPAVVAGIASRPEYGFVAVNTEPAEAARRYFTYVAQQVIACGQALLLGQTDSPYQQPEGFRVVNELI